MFLRHAAIAASILCTSFASASAGTVLYAALNGDPARLEEALAGGGAIEEQNGNAETPLIVAALGGRTDIVLGLIKHGANVNARNDRGMTAIQAAAFAGDVAAVEALLKAGVSVDEAGNKFKVTPLIVAAEENHIDLVRFLIGHGATLEIKEAHGYTALTRSAYKARDEIVTLLLTNGAACQEVDPVWLKDCTQRKAGLGL